MKIKENGTNIKKRIIISLIIGFLLLCSSVLVFIGLQNKENNEIAKASSFLIKDSTFYSNYSDYNEFEIDSYAGLQAFGQYCYKSAYPWTGKTIKLTKDIDCGGGTLVISRNFVGGQYGGANVTPYFNGTFDGNNFTISNFIIGSPSVGLASYHVTGSGGGYSASVYSNGLFTKIGSNAVIKNLRLNNFSTSISNLTAGGGSGSSSSTYVAAGLVGNADSGAKIENCSIDNFKYNAKYSTFSSNGSGGVYYGYVNGLSGIIASGYGTISNCYVGKITPVYYTGTDMKITGIGPSVTKVTANTNSYTTFKSTITNCISNGQSVSVLSSTNSYSSANTTTGLNCGSAGGSSGTLWYYGGADYNVGFPYLRRFINWTEIFFSTNPNAVGSVSPASIEIPSDYSISNKFDKVPSVEILKQTVTASSEDAYNFVSWSGSGTSYCANFELKTFKVKFGNKVEYLQADGTVLSGDLVSNPSKNGNVSLEYEFTIPYGTVLSLETFIDSDNCSCFKYVFTLNNIQQEISYKCYDKEYSINTDKLLNSITVTSEISICPYYRIKSYQVSFA